jgi:hypothetical protein
MYLGFYFLVYAFTSNSFGDNLITEHATFGKIGAQSSSMTNGCNAMNTDNIAEEDKVASDDSITYLKVPPHVKFFATELELSDQLWIGPATCYFNQVIRNLIWLLIFTELLSETGYLANECMCLVVALRRFQISDRLDLSLKRPIQQHVLLRFAREVD